MEIYQKVKVQLTDILCSLSDRESHYFEEILNLQKSVCGRILTLLMSGCDLIEISQFPLFRTFFKRAINILVKFTKWTEIVFHFIYPSNIKLLKKIVKKIYISDFPFLSTRGKMESAYWRKTHFDFISGKTQSQPSMVQEGLVASDMVADMASILSIQLHCSDVRQDY